MAMNNEEKKPPSAEELRYLSNVYNDRYIAITSEIRNIITDIENLNRSMSTLIQYDSIKGKPILTMLSKVIYLKGTAGVEDKVLVEVGGGYFIEMAIERAKQFLKTVIENKNKYLNSLSKEKDQLENILLRLSYRLV